MFSKIIVSSLVFEDFGLKSDPIDQKPINCA